MSIRLERIPEGYYEPVTGTTIRKLEHYGGGGHGAGETVWELDGVAIVRTLREVRDFLAPYVRLAQ